MAHWRLPQAIVIKRSGAAEAAPHDHSVAVAGQSVTGGTENLVTLFAALTISLVTGIGNTSTSSG